MKPEAVADLVGAHRASVYSWEAGREPQLRHAVALADLYDVSLDDFFVHSEQPASAAGVGG